jgi:hypothetical protein
MRRFHTVDVEFFPDRPGVRTRIAWFPAQSTLPVPENTFMTCHWERGLRDGVGEIPSTRRPRGNLPEYECGPLPYTGTAAEWRRGATGLATLDPDTGLPAGIAAPKRGQGSEVCEGSSLVERT